MVIDSMHQHGLLERLLAVLYTRKSVHASNFINNVIKPAQK